MTDDRGKKVAYDPRDLTDEDEVQENPRLTLMEEVLLLGLKDRAVSQLAEELHTRQLTSIGNRATCHSGMTTYHTRYVAAFCWSSRCVVESQ